MAARRLATALWRHAGSSTISVTAPACPSWAPSVASVTGRCSFGTAAEAGSERSAAPAAGPERYGGQTLEEIRSRVFGTHIGNGLSSGRKLLRKKLVGDKIASYYGEAVEKSDPLFEHLDDDRRVFQGHWLICRRLPPCCPARSRCHCHFAGIDCLTLTLPLVKQCLLHWELLVRPGTGSCHSGSSCCRREVRFAHSCIAKSGPTWALLRHSRGP